MKKTWKKLVCAALAAISVLGLSACTKETVINAYDIAVKNGFVGTEQEWLQSLHGADGADGEDLNIDDVYQWAQEKGFEGTYLEFLQTLGLEYIENNDTEMLAQNITSTVEICCGFTRTVTSSGWGTKSTTYASGSAGSGVIYSVNREKSTAIIITNYHVIYSNSMTVSQGNGQYATVTGVDQTNGISDCVYVYPYGELNYFSSGDTDGDTVLDGDRGDKNHGIRAHVIGGAMDYDIAILVTDASEEYFGENGMATAADLGDSNAATVGEKVYAIGNANGQGIAITSGALSVESEYITMGKTDGSNASVRYRVMRTDAAINHGNSGGGLYNANGELIGITNAKNVEDETDNMGYALPITQVKYLVENMLDNRTRGGYVSRAMLGIETLINASSASIVNGKLTITEEIIVSSTPEAGAAAYGKLYYGDVLQAVTIKGTRYELTRNFILPELLLTVRNGETITLHIDNQGTAKNVEITFSDSHFTKYA
ncbi:MAG: serine protease [Clostridia bacterium]|nr:serine protease [Clostridia bacterium]